MLNIIRIREASQTLYIHYCDMLRFANNLDISYFYGDWHFIFCNCCGYFICELYISQKIGFTLSIDIHELLYSHHYSQSPRAILFHLSTFHALLRFFCLIFPLLKAMLILFNFLLIEYLIWINAMVLFI